MTASWGDRDGSPQRTRGPARSDQERAQEDVQRRCVGDGGDAVQRGRAGVRGRGEYEPDGGDIPDRLRVLDLHDLVEFGLADGRAARLLGLQRGAVTDPV